MRKFSKIFRIFRRFFEKNLVPLNNTPPKFLLKNEGPVLWTGFLEFIFEQFIACWSRNFGNFPEKFFSVNQWKYLKFFYQSFLINCNDLGCILNMHLPQKRLLDISSGFCLFTKTLCFGQNDHLSNSFSNFWKVHKNLFNAKVAFFTGNSILSRLYRYIKC